MSEVTGAAGAPTPVPPLSMMIRFSGPTTFGRIQEYGIEVQQPLPAVGSLEASKLTYVKRAPVAAVSETYRLSDSFYGKPVLESIDRLREAVGKLKLEPATADTTIARLAPMQLRVSVLESPLSAPRTWTFDLANAPEGTKQALGAAVSLIEWTAYGTKPHRQVWAGVPDWEEVRGFHRTGQVATATQPAPAEPSPPPAATSTSGKTVVEVAAA